ncbi:hypothetical protein H8D64_00895, partial [PVC group bacterium]|nr:hypothetical protein [PVC group bacterium]
MKIHKKIIVMCSLLCAIKCAAGNYYVNTNGSDSANGSFAAPWLTIQHAVNNVSAGDTVYARSGLYSEQVTFSNSGSAVSGHITLKNYANENPIIDGTSLTVSDGKDALL